ncbi:MAG TPA: hypothetical protein VF909_09910 [Roseiflexaceae bacterium]
MRRSLRFRRRSSSRLRPVTVVGCRLAIAVVALFVAACLGRLLAPETPLFCELLPLAAVLLGVMMRFYFSRQGRE